MQVPLRISYHHCAPSDALNALIREKALELERFYPRITSCRVVVERPGYHHRHGKGAHFRVRIEVSVPGELLVVSSRISCVGIVATSRHASVHRMVE